MSAEEVSVCPRRQDNEESTVNCVGALEQTLVASGATANPLLNSYGSLDSVNHSCPRSGTLLRCRGACRACSGPSNRDEALQELVTASHSGSPQNSKAQYVTLGFLADPPDASLMVAQTVVEQVQVVHTGLRRSDPGGGRNYISDYWAHHVHACVELSAGGCPLCGPHPGVHVHRRPLVLSLAGSDRQPLQRRTISRRVVSGHVCNEIQVQTVVRNIC
jgi:hypothetical protein